jgi:PIF1-like helicase
MDNSEIAEVELIPSIPMQLSEVLPTIGVDCLFPDQHWAYDIVDWHLQETIKGHNPPQLLMIIPGEGGVGKSETIQAITENFRSKHKPLVKGAYTGIAASVIDGKTLHQLIMLPLNGGRQSAKTTKQLEAFWTNKRYLIIDEISMVSRSFLAKMSAIITTAKMGSYQLASDKPFGGLNVILVGDFHQFPPVVTKKSAPLFWPCNPSVDTKEEMVGRKIYEEFNIVVRLKQQVRVTDTEWNDLLQHVCYGNCWAHHLQILRDLIITSPNCPPTNFDTSPWNNAVLVTPRHTVRTHWNTAAALKDCKSKGIQLFWCQAEDTIEGRPLSIEEHFGVLGMTSQWRGRNRKEKGGLQNVVELAIGMKVMVTYNINTDLDIANGARGQIVNIVLDESEPEFSREAKIVDLKFPPLYVLVQLSRTKVPPLEGLEDGVLPIAPMERSFTFQDATGNVKTVLRRQLPITSAYAFTDYWGQGQTINPVIVDIGKPPSGELTPFTQHPSEHLRQEDRRLEKLDKDTENWWLQEKQKY